MYNISYQSFKVGKGRYEGNVTKSAGYFVYVQDKNGSWMGEYPDTMTTAEVVLALNYVEPTETDEPPASVTDLHSTMYI